MQTIWLHQQQGKECLLFFSGWGMDPTPFAHLDNDRLDVCFVHDYRQLAPFSLDILSGYQQVHLVAWSMGVWVAGTFLTNAERLASGTALGGTLHPIDPNRGIPPERYHDLIATFGQQTLEDFYQAMFDDPAEVARFLAHKPQRSLPSLAEELKTFRQAFFDSGEGADIYSRRLVTKRDRIFSGRNQMRAWGKENAETLPWPHFPFFGLGSWRALIDGSTSL